MERIKKILHIITLLSLVALSLAWTTQPVNAAAQILVSTPIDEDGTPTRPYTTLCSLREAVRSANENTSIGGCTAGTPGQDIIRIPASAIPYSLTTPDANQNDPDNNAKTGDLDIREPVQIYGAADDLPTISGYSSSRVFHILTNGSVLLRDLRITGGDIAQKGGGIYIDGAFGVYKPIVTLSRVDIFDNHARSAGGGLVVGSGVTAYVYYSEISNNTAPTAGGVLNEGTLVVDSSLIFSNKGTSGVGGITANTVGAEKTRIVNTTIAQNNAVTGSGAGVSVSIGSILEMLNDTVVDNYGLGLEVKPGGEIKVSIRNTIIARQNNGNSSNCSIPIVPSDGESYYTEEYNLASDSTCIFTGAGDHQDVAIANLGIDSALANNGGPTQTYALIDTANSQALDTGNNATCPSSDQRQRGRPAVGKAIGGSQTCDIGAFELNGTTYMTYISLIRR